MCQDTTKGSLSKKGSIIMPTKTPESFNYLSNNPEYVPDPEIEEFMGRRSRTPPRIRTCWPASAQQHRRLAAGRRWRHRTPPGKNVNESGSESFAGDSPTPDQSMVEENAHAMGINFEDNEELDFDKIERRDRDRYELEEQSKTREDTI